MMENTGIKDIFTFAAYWVVVPIILVGLFFLGRSIMLNVPMGENRTSARSGFWAGLVLFVIGEKEKRGTHPILFGMLPAALSLPVRILLSLKKLCTFSHT